VRRIVIGIVLLLVIAVAAASLFLGTIVRQSVVTLGPRLLGVPVQLEGARFSLLRGKARLDGLVVGNPEGFKAPEAMRLQRLEADVRMSSLFSDPLVIERIYVGGPEITYEVTPRGTNLGKLGEGTVAKSDEPKEEAAEPKPDTGKPGKKVVINDLTIEDAKMNFSLAGMQGKAVPLPIPTIHLTDIGKESGGASPREVLTQVLGALGQAGAGVASSSKELLGAGAREIGKALRAGGDLAGEGLGAAGDTAAEGVKQLGKGLSGLLKKATDKEE
jgi:uncharacterized protein involved in outer membrane biogenesis